MTPPKISGDLLDKFEKGLCSPAEYRQVTDWLQSADETNEAGLFLQKYWEQPLAGIPEPDYQQLFRKINTSIRQRATPGFVSWHRHGLGLAAVFLGVLVAGLAILYGRQSNQVTYHTAYGQQLSIVLPDSSVVELNGNSRLTYQANWQEQESREIWLEGEGFFSVQHLKNHRKFIVHTRNKLAVEVLGTRFNVLTRPSGTQVMLSSGKIRLAIPEAGSVLLKPGELFQCKDKPALYTKAVVNPTAYTAWRAHKLVLNNTSLKHILTRLQEVHGIAVQVSDPALLALKGSGTMPAGNPDTLLLVLAETFGLKVKHTAAGILLEPDRKLTD